MQWLIDIVLEWIQSQGYLTTSLINRGDPPLWDFLVGDFITDGQWHDLDLSGIIPENVKAISVLAAINATTVGLYVFFRQKGNSNLYNRGDIRTVVANLWNTGDMTLIPDANRKIQYQTSAATFTAIDLVVKGWWF